MVRSALGSVRAGAGAAKHRAQDLNHNGQAVALVRAKLSGCARRQHGPLFRDLLLLHDRVALTVCNPTRHHRHSQSLRQHNLVPGHGRHRGVEDERRLVLRWRRDADRVEANQWLRSVHRQHVEAARGHCDTDHVVLQRHRGVVRACAEVAAIHGGYGADAVLPGPLYSHVHGHRADDQAVPAVAVDGRCGVHLSHDANVRARVDCVLFELLDVAAEHVADAVRLDAAHVCVYEHVCGLFCVGLGHAHLEKDVYDGCGHVVWHDVDCDVRGHVEAFEQFLSFRDRSGLVRRWEYSSNFMPRNFMTSLRSARSRSASLR